MRSFFVLALALALGYCASCGFAYGDAGTQQKSKAPVQKRSKAYVCDSKIGGIIPKTKIGPVHVYHSSVVICPQGRRPTVFENGRKVSNPDCTFYGTRPGVSTFQVEAKRLDVSCRPAQVPAPVVRKRVSSFNEPYHPLKNNCQHAASKIIKK